MISQINKNYYLFTSIIFILIILNGCNGESNYHQVALDYKITTLDSTKEVKKLTIIYIYSYDTLIMKELWKKRDGTPVQISQTVFLLIDNSLYRLNSKTGEKVIYLTIKSNDCIEYNDDRDLPFGKFHKNCFLGKDSIYINKKIYDNLYVFKRTIGGIDGITSIIYLNEKFQLIKEEYMSGYTDDYKIELLTWL